MIDEAIEKIKAEMAANANNSYIQAVGSMLLQYMQYMPTRVQTAEQILAEGKTISGSLAEMQKEARKKQVGNCAVLTDQEGFEIVLRYFEIEAVTEVQSQSVSAHAVATVKREKTSTNFDVSLDDLLSDL